MKHCTLPTLLAVKMTILPTVPAKNDKNSETGKVCIERNQTIEIRLIESIEFQSKIENLKKFSSVRLTTSGLKGDKCENKNSMDDTTLPTIKSANIQHSSTIP